MPILETDKFSDGKYFSLTFLGIAPYGGTNGLKGRALQIQVARIMINYVHTD